MRSLLDARTGKDCKIVAEGDSWLPYPVVKDVIDYLRQVGYAIKRHSKPGDTLENMVYGTDFAIATQVQRANNFGPVSLKETLRSVKNLKPKFVLFSAGGNDVVGTELAQYLNHKRSGLPLFREAYFRDSVNGHIRSAIVHFLEQVWHEIHILMHGYDYAIPNGTLVLAVVRPRAGCGGVFVVPKVMRQAGLASGKQQLLVYACCWRPPFPESRPLICDKNNAAPG